jgi:hypothetical protein
MIARPEHCVNERAGAAKAEPQVQPIEVLLQGAMAHAELVGQFLVDEDWTIQQALEDFFLTRCDLRDSVTATPRSAGEADSAHPVPWYHYNRRRQILAPRSANGLREPPLPIQRGRGFNTTTTVGLSVTITKNRPKRMNSPTR